MRLLLLLVVIVVITCFVYTDAGEGTPVSLPVIVNGDGLPLGVSLSEARHIVALDGHVFVALPATANITLMLKISPIEGFIDASFISSRLVGEELLVGSTSDCLYQVTLVGDNEGQGLVNLCNSLVSIDVMKIMHDIVLVIGQASTLG